MLVNQGLAKSRTLAQALIMAGQVCIGDQLVKKPSDKFPADTQLRLKDGALHKYVSRGGDKIESVLKKTGIDPTGMRVLDVGISTGGFSDCLLQSGAKEIVGVDVGHNQLDWKLRKDPRVKLYEGVNARFIYETLKDTEPFDLIVMDVSFISQTLIIDKLIPYLKPNGLVLTLIKPQFEVGPADVGKGGIVKDLQLHDKVIAKLTDHFKNLGFQVLGVFPSEVKGTDGNQEYFLHSTHPGSSGLPNSANSTRPPKAT